MVGTSSIAELAALIGDPARANMLFALRDDEVISAGDLSAVAGVAPSTASGHLSRLIEAGLVRMTARGRNRYYSLATSEVADILEGLESVATALADKGLATVRYDQAEVHGRCCCDHLAGRLGVRLTSALIAKGYVSHGAEGPDLTQRGAEWLHGFGIDAQALRAQPRRFIRLCPDWSERSVHLGGSVGGAILQGMIHQDWIRRARGSRTVNITPRGFAELRSRFELDLRAR